ncbi:MAG TPA: hypothetical protein VGB26_10045 [Nitrospiria bacterium]
MQKNIFNNLLPVFSYLKDRIKTYFWSLVFRVQIAVFLIFLIPMLVHASPDEPDPFEPEFEKEEWYIGPRLGYSPFTSIVGLEIQHRHFALSLGFPPKVGFKYYFKPYRHSWFVGGSFSYYKTDTKDFSGDKTETEGGGGGGFRWRWGTGWDFSISLSVLYGEEKEKTGSLVKKNNYIGLRPGITVGYSF